MISKTNDNDCKSSFKFRRSTSGCDSFGSCVSKGRPQKGFDTTVGPLLALRGEDL